MTVEVGVTTSPYNALDKTINTLLTLTGDLRDESEISNPDVLVGVDNTIPPQCNYCHIPEFNRYYYIREINAYRNSMFILHLHCDVLMSFKDYIRQCSGVVARQENNWNLYLDDNMFRAYANPIVQTKVFPSGFNQSDFSYILAVAGNQLTVT